MGLVGILLLVVFVSASVILILVVLIQDDQGEGIAGMFGGGGTTPLGSRSGNPLTRFTSILGAIFIFGAFSLSWMNRSPESVDVIKKARVEQLREAEQDNWWVEKIDQPEQAELESEEQPTEDGGSPKSEEQSTEDSSSLNR